MELFINQGKDSTIEPAYLTETKQTTSESVLISKTITENDTYNAVDDNADGYSSVTVNVPTGAEVFEVTITSPEMNVYVANKTYAETMAAIQNGDAVSFTVTEEGTTTESLGYFLLSDVGDTIYIL